MRKIAVSVASFSDEELETLISDENSCVSKVRKVYHISLHPFHLTNVKASVREILDLKVAKYDKRLEGILLAYRNVQVLNSHGALSENCYVHLDTEAEFYLFKPVVGQVLAGTVIKKSPNHVACLVHRLFNVAVPRSPDAPWHGNQVSLRDEILVRVTAVNWRPTLPYIRAEIHEITVDHSTEDETNPGAKVGKRKSHSASLRPFLSPEIFGGEPSGLETTQQKSKKTPRKTPAEGSSNGTESEGISSETQAPIRKDKKKQKPSLEINVQNDSTEENIVQEKPPKKSKKKEKLLAKLEQIPPEDIKSVAGKLNNLPSDDQNHKTKNNSKLKAIDDTANCSSSSTSSSSTVAKKIKKAEKDSLESGKRKRKQTAEAFSASEQTNEMPKNKRIKVEKSEADPKPAVSQSQNSLADFISLADIRVKKEKFDEAYNRVESGRVLQNSAQGSDALSRNKKISNTLSKVKQEKNGNGNVAKVKPEPRHASTKDTSDDIFNLPFDPELESILSKPISPEFETEMKKSNEKQKRKRKPVA